VLFKIMNPTRELSHILVFDEAQSQLWSRNLEMRGRQSLMATLATQSRAFGLGILVLAQNPATKLMTEIIANSCIKLCFHLGSGQEIHQMGQHMGLSLDQMATLHHLKIGEAICRVGLGYTEPVHLEIYNFQDQPVSNDELSSMMKPAWDRLLDGIEPARLEPKPQEFIEAPKRIEQTGTRSETDVKVSQTSPDSESSADSVAGERLRTSPDSELTSDEQAYLRIVKSHPWRLISEGYALLNNEDVMGTERISQSRAVKTRKKLLNKRFLEVFTVLGTGKSGRSLCDIVAEKANMGKVPKPRGGLLHAWWSYRIGAWYKIKGAEVKIGDTLGGNECDVGLMLDGKSIGFEVVVSGLVVGNLEKHLSYYDEMIVGCIDSGKEKEMIKLIENLTDGVRKRVKVELLKKYFVSL